MTLDAFLEELPALGPWHLRSSLGMIRRTGGDCPVQAVARLYGLPITEGHPGGPGTFAARLGMPEQLAADLVDAADGLAAVYGELGVVPSDVAWLRSLRARLLAACGLA